MAHPSGGQQLLPCQGEAWFFPNFLPALEADAALENLKSEIAWKQEPIKIFGREVMQPRLTAWHGDPTAAYRYSGLSLKPAAWTPTLLQLRAKLREMAEFNSVLLNRYRNGQDSMGWHRDNEPELGKNPPIASLSLGASRAFHLKNIENPSLKVSIELTHGSLLLMQGSTQHYWKHALPKTKRDLGERINLTFRSVRA